MYSQTAVEHHSAGRVYRHFVNRKLKEDDLSTYSRVQQRQSVICQLTSISVAKRFPYGQLPAILNTITTKNPPEKDTSSLLSIDSCCLSRVEILISRKTPAINHASYASCLQLQVPRSQPSTEQTYDYCHNNINQQFTSFRCAPNTPTS